MEAQSDPEAEEVRRQRRLAIARLCEIKRWVASTVSTLEPTFLWRHNLMVGTFDPAKQMGASQADTVKIKLRTEILFLRLDQIEPDPEQPRQEFDGDGLARLAESLRKFSQLQPVLVRKEGSRYILVTGERRWR